MTSVDRALDPDRRSSELERPGLARPLVVAGIVAGVALRVVILLTPIGRPDADEVIAGLMARHLGTDGLPLFFWGQHYGGVPEVLPVALSMAVFGDSVIAMRLPGLTLAAASSVLLWRLATRLLDRRGAQLAGLLSWVGAAPAVWLSVREMLFYVPTVFVGLAGAICAFRIREGARGWNRAGLVASILVGLWLSPNIVYFAVPTLVVLGRVRPVDWSPRARWGAVGLVVSATLGWIVLWQATERVAGLAAVGRALDPGGYPARVAFFFTTGLPGLPGLLGTRSMFTFDWVGGPVGPVAYLALLALIVGGLGRGLRGWTWDGIGLAAFPFVFALVPKATDQPNLRYMFFLVPFLAVAVVRAATPVRPRPWTAALAVAVALSMTTVGLHRIHVVSEVDRSVRVGNVGDLDQVIARLDEARVRAVFASYWVSFRLAFESQERIVAVQPWDEQRYQPYLDQVMADPRRAWVVSPGRSRDALMEALAQAGVTSREEPVGEFVVVFTDEPVRPEALDGPVRTAL